MRNPIAQAFLAVIITVSLGSAQGPSGPIAKTDATARKNATNKVARGKAYQVGTASWYGSDFDGKTTASGEPFDMYDLTAAHPALPLGSMVKVTNLHNGRAVMVRINDRGPVVPGRIIDLSYSAAKALEFKSQGLQRVRLDVVRPQLVALARD